MIVEQMILKSQPVMNKIHAQAFIQEISLGTLAKEKFVFYLNQDAIYLAEFAKALALTASKLTAHHQGERFMQFALEAMQTERQFHVNYFKEHQLALSKTMDASPSCFMYTNYLLKTASAASVEEAVASLLPCFWVYSEVGKKLKANSVRENPYQSWIDVYASDEFAHSVQSAIAIMNELGDLASAFIKEKMITAFHRSTQLEWLFWDSAYRLETWTI